MRPDHLVTVNHLRSEGEYLCDAFDRQDRQTGLLYHFQGQLWAIDARTWEARKPTGAEKDAARAHLDLM